jgi:hypothetical protein
VGDWGTDGTVYTQTVVGNTVYIGGKFSHLVNPKTGKKIVANNLAALNASNGIPVTTWHPSTNNTVFKLAHSDNGWVVYAGGAFTSANGSARGHIAAFDASNGGMYQGWNPAPNGAVRAILPVGNNVILGGDFTSMQGASHLRVAAVNALSGAAVPGWNASADCRVQALASDGTNLYIGGYFSTYNGVSAPGLVRVAASNGAYDSFFNAHYIANQPGCNPAKHHEGMSPFDMTLSGGTLYVAVGGLRNILDSLSASTGQVFWRDTADGDFQTLALIGSTLYAGGHFDQIIYYNGGNSSSGGMDHVARFNASNGALDTSWFPQLSPSHSPYFYGCWSLVTNGSSLYAGGVFQKVNGASHRSFAIFPGQ